MWNQSLSFIFCMIFEEKYFSCYILLTDQFSLPDCLYFSRHLAICLLRLRGTHNALQLPVFCFFFIFFSFFCQPYPEYRGIRSKKLFTDHGKANTIHDFRDSFQVLKIHGCYQNSQKFEQLSIQAIRGNEAISQLAT